MPAGLLKRLISSLIDFAIVVVILYGAYFFVGQYSLQGRISNYELLEADYSEVMVVYNADLESITSDYDAAMTIAGEDEALQELATEELRLKQSILNAQNTSDIIPYNNPLTTYIVDSIDFFVIGFAVLITVLAMAFTGKTPGRRLLKLTLKGRNKNEELVEPNILMVFLHDSMFKYVLICGLIVYNLLLGITALFIGFIIDVVLITLTRNGSTIRDLVTGVKVYNN